MNFVARIRGVIDAMGVALGSEETPFPIIRSNQGKDKPPYPHGIFTKLVGNGEEPHRHSRTQEEKEDDPLTVVEVRSETIKYSISLSFLGVGDDEPLYALAEKARNWLISDAGEDACAAQQLVARLTGDITDRSVLMEQTFEKRVGFDFRLDGQNEIRQDKPVIKTVEVNGKTLTLIEDEEDEEE